jgi:hypothetical protein
MRRLSDNLERVPAPGGNPPRQDEEIPAHHRAVDLDFCLCFAKTISGLIREIHAAIVEGLVFMAKLLGHTLFRAESWSRGPAAQFHHEGHEVLNTWPAFLRALRVLRGEKAFSVIRDQYKDHK